MKSDLVLNRETRAENLTLLLVGTLIAVSMACVFYVRVPSTVNVLGIGIDQPLVSGLAFMTLGFSAVSLFAVALAKTEVTLLRALYPAVPAVQVAGQTDSRTLEAVIIAALILSGVTTAVALTRRFQAKVSK